MRSFSLIGARGQIVVQGVISALNEALSNNFLKEKLPGMDPASLKKPIKSKDFVIVQDRMAEGSANMVAGMISQQSMFIPIVLMMIIIYSSQMVISAVAMEKQNKTLETLLTVPIKRTSIITAKMLAAGLIGLISAVVYMFGMQSFLGGIGDEARAAGAQAGGPALMQKLGLYLRHDGLHHPRPVHLPGHPGRPGHGHDPRGARRGLPQRPEHDHAADVHGHDPLLHLHVRRS